MKRLLTVLLVMAFIVTAFAGVSFAQGSQSKMGAANNQPRYNAADNGNYGIGYNRIELSEEQINQIADLREEFYNETEELRDQMRDLNFELRDLEFRGASNEESGAVEDKIEAVLVQMDEKRTTNQEKMEAVLTEEQLALAEENRQNFEGRFQGRFDNDFGPRSSRSYGKNRHSGFRDDFGSGMMGRNFHGNRNDSFRGSRAYNNRDFGYGPGFCH